MWAKMKEFFKKDWTPAEKVLILLCCVLIGVIKGFLLAPIKGGINCGNGDKYVLDDENFDDLEDQDYAE